MGEQQSWVPECALLNGRGEPIGQPQTPGPDLWVTFRNDGPSRIDGATIAWLQADGQVAGQTAPHSIDPGDTLSVQITMSDV